MEIYIGVDPGKKGGFAVIIDGAPHTYPWDDAEFKNCMGNMAYLAEGNEGRIVACVEKVGAMHGQGVTGMFNFGKSAGYIEGVLAALEIPFQLIPPQTWKKAFGLNSDKAKSIEVCKRLFPGVSLLPSEKCKKDSDGMAEALLMAEYARRKL